MCLHINFFKMTLPKEFDDAIKKKKKKKNNFNKNLILNYTRAYIIYKSSQFDQFIH